MSADHLAFVRTLPCVCCGAAPPSHAHHLLRTGDPTQRGTGRKASDKWALPTCDNHPPVIGCHHKLHVSPLGEEGFLASCGVDGRAVAKALWSNRGDLDGMRRVIDRALQDANLKRSA